VRVIAGESLGTRGAIESRTPIPYLHLTLLPGREPRPRRSAGQPDPQGEGRVVVFANDGDEISISNPSAEPLPIAGEPIGEPVERYGPFVMNTREEVGQAFRDFREGKMGTIATS